MHRHTIIISPIGNIPEWINQTLEKRMTEIFSMETRVQPLLADIEFAYDMDRDQYYSTKILQTLEMVSPQDCLKILAVTKKDLFIPILTHVYGEAQLGGKAGIISISRLVDESDTDPLKIGRKRIVKEAAHELGHTFDLRHCEDPGCIMHYCRKLEDVDHKSDRFCRYCQILFADSLKHLEQ